MTRRILIGSFEVPGFGGAATVGYNLFETLREGGLDIWFLNIVSLEDAGFFRFHYGSSLGNPKGLGRVENHFLSHPTFATQPELASLLEELAPDLLVGMGWIASLLLKRAAPTTRTILYTTGCNQVKELLKQGRIRDSISLQTFVESSAGDLIRPCREEKDAASIADLIVTHSELTRDLFYYFFPRLQPKIYPCVIWMVQWILAEASEYRNAARPFRERDIDVLFVASSWGRLEKNYPLVKELIAAGEGWNVHVAGEVESRAERAHYHGLIPERQRVFRLLGNAKTVVCPSLFDAAPGVLFEAAAMGANVVASRNCGNWMLCHEDLQVHPPSSRNFRAAIQRSLERERPANLEYFGNAASGDAFTELLEVF